MSPNGGRYRVPLDVYHGVPTGWTASQILDEHQTLGGTFDLTGPRATEPGAPAWLPDRDIWLQYRAMLYRVAEGVRTNDPACVELAVRYIELRYIGSYSGFVRARLSRTLKRASLTKGQKARLVAHFLQLIENGERTQEFREYLRLWRKLLVESELAEIEAKVIQLPNGQAKAVWLMNQLRPGRSSKKRANERPDLR